MKHVAILKSRIDAKGGLEKYTRRIASAFTETGAEVSLLTTGVPQILLPSVSIHACPTPSIFPSSRIEQFDRFTKNWLQEHPADLIFGMDRNRMQTHIRAGNGVHAAYLESRRLAEGKWKRFLCSLNPMHRKILEIEKEAFEQPLLQKLFVNSHWVKEQILSRYKTDPKKIEVIHNGVEWNEMESDFAGWEEVRKTLLQERGLDPDRFQFLFIGNGYLRKGLDPLLESLARIQNRDLQLSIVGKEKRMGAYQANCARLGLNGTVKFFGPQNEIRPFYQMADCLAIPSFYDPFANVTVEALAMGLHVVSSKWNGGCEVLTSGNGTIIENLLDPEAMDQALRNAFRFRKTKTSAESVRKSVETLDFSKQLKTLIRGCLVE